MSELGKCSHVLKLFTNLMRNISFTLREGGKTSKYNEKFCNFAHSDEFLVGTGIITKIVEYA